MRARGLVRSVLIKWLDKCGQFVFRILKKIFVTALGSCYFVSPIAIAESGSGQTTIGARVGEKTGEGFVSFMVPLKREGDSLFFFNPRAALKDEGDAEGNLGLGFRQAINGNKAIIGGNVFYDRRRSSTDHSWDQWGVGLEILTDRVDARINYYDPDNKQVMTNEVPISNTETTVSSSSSSSTTLSQSTSSSVVDVTTTSTGGATVFEGNSLAQDIVDTTATTTQNVTTTKAVTTTRRTTTTTRTITDSFLEQFEGGLKGFDAEVGLNLKLPGNLPETRVFAGYYDFENPFGENIKGGKARLEMRAGPHLTFDAEIFEDEELNGSQYFVGARLHIPFNAGQLWSGKNPFKAKNVRSNLRKFKQRPLIARIASDEIIRDVRIQTRESELAENLKRRKSRTDIDKDVDVEQTVQVSKSVETRVTSEDVARTVALTSNGDVISVTHIDSNDGGGGSEAGTFENPATNATTANAAPDNDYIVLHGGTVLAGTLNLDDDDTILGEGGGAQLTISTDQLGTIPLPETAAGATAGARATVGGVAISSNNVTVNNINVGAAGITTAGGGTTHSNLTISRVTSAGGVDLGTGGFLDQNIILDNVIVNGSAGNGFGLHNALATANIAVSNSAANNSADNGFAATNAAAGSIFNFTNTDAADSGSAGFAVNASQGTFSFDSASSSSNNFFGFQIDGGAADVTYSGTINNTNAAATAIGISNTMGGTATFDGSAVDAIQDGGLGIALNSNTGNVNVAADTELAGVEGISIVGGDGTFTFSDTHITNTTSEGLDINGGSSIVNVNGTSSLAQNSAASAVSVFGGHDGELNISASINATNGDGLQFDNADGVYDFSGAATLNGGNAGIDILNGSAGTFTFADTDITDPSAMAVNIDASTSTVTFGAASSITQTNAANAVSVTDNTGGTVNFNGLVTANTSTETAVNLTSNAGTTVGFTGGLDIDTTTATGFNAANTAVVNVSGANNSISTSSGVAADLDSVAADITLREITSTGSGAEGVDIDNITGALTVTGDVTVASSTGNALDISASSATFDFQGTTTVNGGAGVGISLNGANGDVTFAAIDINDTGDRSFEVIGATNDVTVNGGEIDQSLIGGFVVTLQDQMNGSNIAFNNVDIAMTNTGTPDAVNLQNTAGRVDFVGGSVMRTGSNDALDIDDLAATGVVNFGSDITHTANLGDTIEIDGSAGTINVSGNVASTGSGSDAIAIGNTSAITGGAITFNGNITADGTNIDINDVAAGASVTFNGTTQVDNATGVGINLANNSGSINFVGDTTVNNATTDGINLQDNASGAVSFGTTNIALGSAVNARGIDYDGTTNGSASFGATTLTGVGNGTGQVGIDFAGADLAGQQEYLSVDISGPATSLDSVAVDLTGLTGNQVVNLGEQVASGASSHISDVHRGVVIDNTAAVQFAFGDGESAVDTGSTIDVNGLAGSFTVDAAGGTLAASNFNFDDVVIGVGDVANLPLVPNEPVLVSSAGGLISAGTNGLSADVTTITVNDALTAANTGQTFVFVGDASGGIDVTDVAFGITGFALDNGQSIDSFNNGNVITIGGVQPVNITGNIGSTGADLTANSVIASNSTAVHNAVITVDGGGNSQISNLSIDGEDSLNGAVVVENVTTASSPVTLQNLMIDNGSATAVFLAGNSEDIMLANVDLVDLNMSGANTGTALAVTGASHAGQITVGSGSDLGNTTGSVIDANVTDNILNIDSSAADINTAGNTLNVININGLAAGSNLNLGNITADGVIADSVINVQNMSGGMVNALNVDITNFGDSTTDTAVNVAGTGGSVSFTELDIAAVNGNALALDAQSLSVSAAGSEISATSGQAIDLAGTAINAAGVSISQVTTGVTSSSDGIVVDNVSGGDLTIATVDLNGTAITTGLDISGDARSSNVIVSGGNINNGISISGDGAGTVTIDAAIAENAGYAVQIANRDGSAGLIDINGTVTSGTGAVSIQGNTAGNVQFDGVITATGTNNAGAINIDGTTGGTTDFNALVDIDVTGSGTGVAIGSTNTGTTINFNGGLDVNAVNGTAFDAQSGSLSVANAGTETVNTSGTGAAINIDGVTVTAGGVSFDSVTNTVATTSGSAVNIASSSGGAINIGTANLVGNGVDISGTVGSAITLADLEVALNANNQMALDMSGAILNADISANDIDITSTSAVGTTGINLVGTTGTGVTQLGDTNTNGGDDATITGVNDGVLFSSTTDLDFTFGDGSSTSPDGIQSSISAVTPINHDGSGLPSSGSYDFNDVNLVGDTSALSGPSVYYVDAAGTGTGASQTSAGNIAGAETASVDAIVLIDTTEDSTQDTIDQASAPHISGGAVNSLELDDGQVLLSLLDGQMLDLSLFGLTGGAPLSFETNIGGSTVITGLASLDDVAPILTTNNGDTIVLAGSSTVQGVTLNNTGTGLGVSGNFGGTEAVSINDSTVHGISLAPTGGTTTLNLNNVASTSTINLDGSGAGSIVLNMTGTNSVVTTTQQILSLDTVTLGGGGASFTSLTSTGTVTAGDAIRLDGISGGSFSGGTVNVAGATSGNGLSIVDTTTNTAFTSIDIDNVSSAGIAISASADGGNSGDFSVSGLTDIDGTGAAGIAIDNHAGATSFANVNINNRGGAGVQVNAFNDGTQDIDFGVLTINNQNTSATTALAVDNINGAGSTVDIASVAINNNAAASSGIALSNNDGATININGGSIANAAGAALSISSSAGTATYAGTVNNTAGRSVQILNNENGGVVNVTGGVTDSGQGVFISNNDQGGGNATANISGGLALNTGTNTAFTATGGGTVNVTGTNTATTSSGTAINIDNVITTAGITFDSASATGLAGNNGIDVNALTGNLTVSAGTITNSGSGKPIEISAGSGTINIASAINSTGASGLSIDVTGRTGGSVTLSGNLTDSAATGGGINIANNAGTVTLSGASQTVNTGINAGVNVSNNTGTVNFSNGGLNIDTTSGAGFSATGGGTVTLTGANNSVASTSGGTAINIQNTLIGAAGITLRDVSATGGTVGIDINGGGSAGFFTITGTGTTNGSGGTIQNTSLNGILVENTDNVTLNNVTLTNANTTDGGGAGSCDGATFSGCNAALEFNNVTDIDITNLNLTGAADHGIFGNNVTDFDLADSLVQNAGNTSNEHGIFLNGMFGTAAGGTGNAITNTTVSNSGNHNVFVRNSTASAATPDLLQITGSTFSNLVVANPAQAIGLLVNSRDSANIRVEVSGSTFTNVLNGIRLNGDGGDISADIQNNNIGHNGTITSPTGTLVGGIESVLTQDSNLDFLFNNNRISMNPVGAVEPAAIRVVGFDTATFDGDITNNTIRNAVNSPTIFGISAKHDQGSGSAVSTVTISGNTINIDATMFGGRGIDLQSGGTGGRRLDAIISNNNITFTNQTGFTESGVFASAGQNIAGESNVLCVDFNSNNANVPTLDDYVLLQHTNSSFILDGLTGSGTSATDVQNYVTAQNTSGTTIVAPPGVIGAPVDNVVNFTAGACNL